MIWQWRKCDKDHVGKTTVQGDVQQQQCCKEKGGGVRPCTEEGKKTWTNGFVEPSDESDAKQRVSP